MHLPARADGVDIDAKAKSAAQSLVIVDFTLRNENTSRQGSGQGIVLNKDGVDLISDSLISESLPKEWITDIKVRLPGKNFEPTPAKFLGRTATGSSPISRPIRRWMHRPLIRARPAN